MKAQTKALLASVVVIALALSAVSGITYSWWSDSEQTEISVTTGFVDVTTSNFKIYKGNVQVQTNDTSSVPSTFNIIYGDDQTDNAPSVWDSRDSTLMINGDPGDDIIIEYRATFSWSVYCKYLMSLTAAQFPGSTMAIVLPASSDPVNAGRWIEPGIQNGEEEYNITITIHGLPENLAQAMIKIENTITQSKNPVPDATADTTPFSDPTASDYTITTAAQLRAFAQEVNGGNNFKEKTVKLGSNIDLGGLAWTPIGRMVEGDSFRDYQFSGTFDGQDHTISNINAYSEDTSGLFGPVLGKICNLTVADSVFIGHHYVGGIAAYSTANNGMEIVNCHVENSTLTSTPSRQYDGKYDNGDKVGGIIGYCVIGDVVKQCSVENVSLKAYRDVGCIVGCFNTGGDAAFPSNTFESNEVRGDNQIIIDQTTGFYESEDPNAGEIIGRHSATINGTNLVAEGATVTISGFASSSADVVNLIESGAEYVSIVKDLTEMPTVFENFCGKLVMDLNGHTIKAGGCIDLENADLTLKNGKIEKTTPGTAIRVNADNGSDGNILTLDGMTIVAIDRAIDALHGEYTINVNHTEIKASTVGIGTYANKQKGGSSYLNIDSSKIIVTDPRDSVGVAFIPMSGQTTESKLSIERSEIESYVMCVLIRNGEAEITDTIFRFLAQKHGVSSDYGNGSNQSEKPGDDNKWATFNNVSSAALVIGGLDNINNGAYHGPKVSLNRCTFVGSTTASTTDKPWTIAIGQHNRPDDATVLKITDSGTMLSEVRAVAYNTGSNNIVSEQSLENGVKYCITYDDSSNSHVSVQPIVGGES